MIPAIHVRTGLPADADVVAVLANQVWLHTYATEGITEEIAAYALAELTPARFRGYLGDPATAVIVAERGRSLVGVAVVEFGARCPAGDESAAELRTLYVQEPFTGRGVGTALLRAAEARAREHSNTRLWLMVNVRNLRAVGFYEHHGYARVGTEFFVLGDGRYENHVLVGPDR